MQHATDLFDTIDASTQPARFVEVFETWAASAAGRGGPMRNESVSVYRDMWMALLKWAVPREVNVRAISAASLEAYLRSRGGSDELDERYAWRFVRLVERVLHHDARTNGAAPNEAVAELLARRLDIKHANASGRDCLPEFLDAADARALVAALTSPESRARPVTWQDMRNRCAVALHLGAGLTPGEVRALRIEAIKGLEFGTRKIRVPANGNVAEHECPVAPWAWRVLQSWLSTRAEHAIAGAWLLPATKAGRAWGKTAHHDAITAVLSAVGLPSAGGAYRLRHTFALRQLKRGRSLSEIARWLGVDETAISRYQRVLPGPVDVI